MPRHSSLFLLITYVTGLTMGIGAIVIGLRSISVLLQSTEVNASEAPASTRISQAVDDSRAIRAALAKPIAAPPLPPPDYSNITAPPYAAWAKAKANAQSASRPKPKPVLQIPSQDPDLRSRSLGYAPRALYGTSSMHAVY